MIYKKTLLILFLFIFIKPLAKAQSVEYSVKAMYIEKFARFTDWQKNIDGDHFVIAILGESPFKGELEKLATKTKIKDKPIKIIYIKNIDELKTCNVLFICASEKKNIIEIMKHIENFNILAIGDTQGFCQKGVHLNFYLDDTETIKYEVNPFALKKSNLTIEMQLLSYGKIIN